LDTLQANASTVVQPNPIHAPVAATTPHQKSGLIGRPLSYADGASPKTHRREAESASIHKGTQYTRSFGGQQLKLGNFNDLGVLFKFFQSHCSPQCGCCRAGGARVSSDPFAPRPQAMLRRCPGWSRGTHCSAHNGCAVKPLLTAAVAAPSSRTPTSSSSAVPSDGCKTRRRCIRSQPAVRSERG